MEQFITLIEEAANMDDLSFMRMTKRSEELETMLNALCAVFDEQVPEHVMHSEFGTLSDQFAKLDVQTRQRIFEDWLAKLSDRNGN